MVASVFGGVSNRPDPVVMPPLSLPLPALPEPEPTPPYEVVLLPYSRKAFQGAMRWATPGQGYTVAELCSAAGVVYPPASKGSTHMLIAAGWTRTDLRRLCQGSKCSVYVKPASELRVAS